MNWQASVIAELGPEVGNLDAAWRWAVENGDYETGRALVMGHYFMAEMVGRYHVAVQLLDDAARSLRHPKASGECPLTRQESDLLLVWILIVQSSLLNHLGILKHGRACIDESLKILNDLDPSERQAELILIAKSGAADFLVRFGDWEGSAWLFREELAQLQTVGGRSWPYVSEIGTQFLEANACMALGRTMWSAGEYAEAQRLLRKSLDLRVRIGEQRHKARGLRLLANVLRTVGVYDEAERLSWDSLALSQAQRDRIGMAASRADLGTILMTAGRHSEATAHYDESLVMARESGNLGLLTRDLNGLGALALARGDLEQAGRRYEESQASFERLGIVGTLGYAATVIGLGNVTLARGELVQAKGYFREALAAPACTAWEKMEAIGGTAEALAREGNAVRAVELLAFAVNHAFTSHQTRERVRGLLCELEAELPSDAFAAATARGRARQVDDVVAELVGG